MRGIWLTLVLVAPALAGSISGTVVDAATSQPGRKVVLTLTLHGTDMFARERSDVDGRFRFDGLPAGQYELRAGGSPAQLIALSDNETRGGVRFRIARSASVSGRVFDDHGQLVGGVVVSILKTAGADNARPVSTNDQGEYTFRDVEPGSYLLRAGGSKAPGTSLGPQEYAGPVNVRPGEQLADRNFHLRTEETHQIHGRLAGVPEGEDRTVRIQMTAADRGAPLSSRQADSDAPDWWFSFDDTVAGTYVLDARLKKDGKVWAATRTVDSRMPDESVRLALAPAVDVTGEIAAEGGPLASMEVRLTRVGAGVREAISAKPGADGHFVLAQVPAGKWRLEMTGMPSPGFVRQARFGDRDVRTAPLTIESGSDAVLKVVIGLHPGAISGEVGSADAGVIVVSKSCYSTIADAQGKFAIANVPPGKYRALALEKTAPVEFCSEFAAARLSSAQDEIEVKERETVFVHPRLIPAEQVWQ